MDVDLQEIAAISSARTIASVVNDNLRYTDSKIYWMNPAGHGDRLLQIRLFMSDIAHLVK